MNHRSSNLTFFDRHLTANSFLIKCSLWHNFEFSLQTTNYCGLTTNNTNLIFTHPHLNTLSPIELNSEIGGAKQCFLDHGINPTIFTYPYSEGWNNPVVVSTVARYYSLARIDTGFPVTFLRCDGWKTHPQTDCRTFSSDGKLTFANRYSIKSWTHRHIDGPDNHSPLAVEIKTRGMKQFKKLRQELCKDIIDNWFAIIGHDCVTS